MLLADDFGNGARLHPLEHVQALVLPAHQDAVDDAASLVFTQRVDEHLADVVVGAVLMSAWPSSVVTKSPTTVLTSLCARPT